jgi:hypothetical protein
VCVCNRYLYILHVSSINKKERKRDSTRHIAAAVMTTVNNKADNTSFFSSSSSSFSFAPRYYGCDGGGMYGGAEYLGCNKKNRWHQSNILALAENEKHKNSLYRTIDYDAAKSITDIIRRRALTTLYSIARYAPTLWEGNTWILAKYIKDKREQYRERSEA